MDYVEFGSTGLTVSVMGMGCGGPSRLGRSYDRTEDEAVEVVCAALDLGVNVIDTAEAYGTEEAVGRAIAGVERGSLVISTKKSNGPDMTPADVRSGLEASLARLRTDYVDIYHMHGVRPDVYPHIRENIVPTLLDLCAEGKIRFLGITEAFESDPGHATLQQALDDDCWRVMMVGFNLLNQTARERVFARTRERGIATLIMFAVRRAMSQSERMREVLRDLADRGRIDPALAEAEEPLACLMDGGAVSVLDAAYRFCRYEPGVDVVLSGSGSVQHLNENAESLSRPDLSPEARRWAERQFARVDDVSGS